MTEGRPAGQQLVLLCKCAHYDIISRAAREEVLRLLSDGAAGVQVVADLCGLAANRDPRLQEWARTPSLAIIACFPRAIRWLFHAAGAPLSQERVRFFNMRTRSPEEITRELMKDDGSLMIEEKSVSSTSNQQSTIIDQQSDWVPWFPVIDCDRCVNCKQCLNFCLFGVYGLSDEGQVTVQKPSGCKTNCPACARMCPQKAIIFPKYADSPINGDDGQPQGVAPVVAGDVYERIRARTVPGKRFSTQASDASRSCPTLDSLKRELNIPDDVLASLSPAEMQRIIKQSKSQSRADGAGKGENRHE
ncbi:MAG: hypothetical protein ABFD90_14875 [Phycisphaerales bacterium]